MRSSQSCSAPPTPSRAVLSYGLWRNEASGVHGWHSDCSSKLGGIDYAKRNIDTRHRGVRCRLHAVLLHRTERFAETVRQGCLRRRGREVERSHPPLRSRLLATRTEGGRPMQKLMLMLLVGIIGLAPAIAAAQVSSGAPGSTRPNSPLQGSGGPGTRPDYSGSETSPPGALGGPSGAT